MSEKQRYPAALAWELANELVMVLEPVCERIMVCGSLRRNKSEVGDVEIVYQPFLATADAAPVQAQLFAGENEEEELLPLVEAPVVAARFADLLRIGFLRKRLNKKGHEMWGAQNRLAVQPALGIPVDLFATTEASWWNYVVCRTGGSQSNIAICNAARSKGWKWNPYGVGFSRPKGLSQEREIHAVSSEREVFEFAALPWREPHERQ